MLKNGDPDMAEVTGTKGFPDSEDGIDRPSAFRLPGSILEKAFGTVGLHQVEPHPPAGSGEIQAVLVDPFGLLKAAV